jgi:hypothetical protein
MVTARRLSELPPSGDRKQFALANKPGCFQGQNSPTCAQNPASDRRSHEECWRFVIKYFIKAEADHISTQRSIFPCRSSEEIPDQSGPGRVRPRAERISEFPACEDATWLAPIIWPMAAGPLSNCHPTSAMRARSKCPLIGFPLRVAPWHRSSIPGPKPVAFWTYAKRPSTRLSIRPTALRS